LFAIVISEKGGAERREVFDRPEISVGRVQGNDLMLAKGNVSKRHARLIFRDNRFIVTDLNSTNGTYVNRRRISQATIVREGDRIYIGDFVIRVELPESTSEPSTAGAGDPTGSGPIPAAVRAAVAEGAATSFPSERDLEELSGASYPEVPGPPRMPSPGRAHESLSDSHPSEKLPLASVVDVSHADIDLRQVSSSGEDSQHRAYRNAVASVVSRTLSHIDAQELERGIDEATRSRIERVIDERIQELRSQGELAADVEVARVTNDVRAELLELGPLGPLLVDSAVSEVVATRFDTLTAVRAGRHVAIEPGFSSEESLRRVVRRMCRAAGAPLDGESGAVERRLRDGSRLSAVIGASAPAGLLVIQKPRRVGATLEELVRSGTISRAIATFLGQCVAARVNILVVGPRDPGTSAIVGALATAANDARLVLLSELDDVAPADELATRLRPAPRPQETAHALRIAARVPGSRLIVEMTSAEVAAALADAVGDGSNGVVATLHAPSIRRALSRLSGDFASGHTGTPPSAAREWVSATFDVVVEVGRLRDTRLRVLRVCEIGGVNDDEVSVQEIFAFAAERTAAGGAVEGSFNPSGHMPRIAEELATRGFALDTSLFTRPPSR